LSEKYKHTLEVCIAQVLT